MKKILAVASIVMLWTSGAWAAGTLAGTNINNSASLTYSAGGVNQTPPGSEIQSNTDTFVVDNKIDLTVAHSDTVIVPVVPGATAQVLTFTVANTGNKVQDYSLTSTANDGNPFGETDNFDATNVQIFVDSNGNGVYDAGADTATFIDELAPDANVTVFIVADIPASQQNNDVAEYTLTAQVAEGGTSGTKGTDITTDDRNTADNPATEQIVFADGDGAGATDGANDGKHADNNAYKVQTAVLDLTKRSCVYSDPVTNGGTNSANAKRIPGAFITYVFDINNTGSADATDIAITDVIDSNFVYTQASDAVDIFIDANRGTACECQNGVQHGQTTQGTGSAGSNTGNPPEVKIENIGVAAPTSPATENHTCVSFRLEIK